MYETGETILMMRVVIGALLLLAVAVGLLRRRRQGDLRRSWPQVQGEVVGTSAPIAGGARHQPIVQYQTLEGETITVRRRTGWNIVTPVEGRQVPVWYNPADPERFDVQISFVDRHGTLSFILAGLLVVVLLLTMAP